MFTRALDLDDLLATVAGEEPARHAGPGPAAWATSTCTSATSMPRAAFYGDVIGFETMASLAERALPRGAGGYHHHLGANTWRGEGVGPAPAGTVGLREWTIVLEPDALACAPCPARRGRPGGRRRGRGPVGDPPPPRGGPRLSGQSPATRSARRSKNPVHPRSVRRYHSGVR